MKSKNKVKNKPIVPTYKPTSTSEGLYITQLEGRKSRCKEVTTITNRSNHIPIFTNIEMIKVATKLVLIFLNQNN